MPEGRTIRFFDSTIPAVDGDICLIELDETFLADLVQANRDKGKAEWLAKYGENPARLCTKWLKKYRGEMYMCEEKHGCPLGRNRIVGVCRYVLIDGKPVYGSGPDTDGFDDLAPLLATSESEIDISQTSGQAGTGNIADEAVTVIASVEDDSVALPGPGIILTLNITPQNLSYFLVVTASLNVWISANPGAGNSEFFIVVLGNAVNLGESQRVRISSTAAPGERIALQIEVPITPSDEVNLAAFVQWVRDSGTTTGEARSIAIRAESIKK